MKIFLIIFVFSIALPVFPQDCFTVMKIKGTITFESSGEQLNKDDRICSNDKIIFQSKDAAAILYSPDKGRFSIKPGKSSENELSGIFRSLVSSVLSKSTGNTFTRPFNVDFKKSFSDPFFVIDRLELYANEEDYPMNEKAFFILKYIYKGSEISKKLKYNKNLLIFDKADIFDEGTDAEAVGKVTLYYSNISEYKIKTFSLNFIDGSVLKKELTEYMDELKAKGKNNKEITDEFIAYMNDIYGDFDSGYLYEWFDKNLGLKD